MLPPSPETLSLLGIGFVGLFALSKLISARAAPTRRNPSASP